jgi:CheY-like chemotaxis protein
LAQIPIVVISAYGDHYESDALAVGANVVLKKPLDSDLLVNTLNQLKETRGGAQTEV